MAELEAVPEDVSNASPQSSSTGVAGLLDTVVTWWGLAGGLVFCSIVFMSIASIVGRKMFSGPIQGDMELLMMGSAIGSAAFLPLCEMQDHHIKVDALTAWMGKRAHAVLDTLAHGLLAVASGVIGWRTVLYAFECHENMEVSPLLFVPFWQPVSLLVPSLVLLTLAAFYRTALSLKTAIREVQ